MKKTTILFMFLVLSVTSFSQQIKFSSLLTEGDYLQKSKNQKTAAWISVGGGMALFATGYAVYPEDYDWLFGTTPEKEDEATLSGVLIIFGSAAMLTSIPLFIASGKNKRRAARASASLKLETMPTIRHTSFVKSTYPAIALKIGL